MAKDYSEDQLIQRSTAELLEKELGWKSVYAFDNEVLGEQGTLGRKIQSEVVLTRHLRLALKRLNHWMTDKQFDRSYRAHDQLHELADADADQRGEVPVSS